MLKSGCKADMSPSMKTLAEVSEFARSRGLHGVLILSPRCPNCGECHDFEMITDMDVKPTGGDDINQGLSDLLTHFAKVARGGPVEIADADDRHIRQ